MNIVAGVDVAIVGAGPAGLCLATALRGSGLKIAVFERQPRPAIEQAAFDGREIALTWRSVRILRELGIWDRIPADQVFPIRSARVQNGTRRPGMDIAPDSAELGFLVSNHLIRRAAFQAMHENTDAELVASCDIEAVWTNGHGAGLRLADGSVRQTRLLVAADSRFSDTRRALGIPARHLDFGKTMLVCRMNHELPHEHIACEWFGDHQTLATLPLGDRQSSIVLTLPHEKIVALNAMAPESFAREMERRMMGRLGALQLASERFAYPLVAVYPDRFVATRCAAIGDAAVGMHPVTAHGFNLGLLGQQTLANLIQRERGQVDPGSASLLQQYDRIHRRATRPLYLATNAIVRLYTDDSAPARLVRGTLLEIARRVPLVTRQISRALMQAG